MATELFKTGGPGGPGRRPGVPNKATRDFKEAGVRLQKLIDAELNRRFDAPALARPTRIQTIVRNWVLKAQEGDIEATRLIWDRWAGKPIVVLEEKAIVGFDFDALPDMLKRARQRIHSVTEDHGDSDSQQPIN